MALNFSFDHNKKYYDSHCIMHHLMKFDSFPFFSTNNHRLSIMRRSYHSKIDYIMACIQWDDSA